jgi:hypothetical protein
MRLRRLSGIWKKGTPEGKWSSLWYMMTTFMAAQVPVVAFFAIKRPPR